MNDEHNHPTRPFWKDEHVTRWLTASRAFAMFVLAMMLAICALAASGIFLASQIKNIQKTRAAAAEDRRDLHRQLDTAICVILDTYVRARPNDPIAPVRKAHHCKIQD